MGLALDLLPASGIAGPWHLIFNDEFNGSSLDLTKWSSGWRPAGTGGITGPIDITYGLDVCSDAQITVANGAASITAILETNTSPNGTYNYTSGCFMTLTNTTPWTPIFSFLYGYCEARIWLPANGTASANWPAFWLQPTYAIIYPTLSHTFPNAEIDILESLSGTVQAHVLSTSGNQGPYSDLLVGGWHTYGVDWEAGVCTFYYDGVSIGTTPTAYAQGPVYIVFDLRDFQFSQSSGDSSLNDDD